VTYLVDSDYVADYLKGRPAAVSLLDGLFTAGLAISIVTFAEVYEGIYYGTDPSGNEAIFEHFLRGVRVLPIGRRVAKPFARVRGDLRTKGQLIPQPDLFVAATALEHHLNLVTRNRGDFVLISGLQLHSSP
jgi:tRNA(fMet)-specific endonuclease VapC